MKSIIKYILVIVVISVIGSGCTKKFENLNTDPTAAGPDQFNPNFLLTTAEVDYTGSQISAMKHGGHN
jgi:hypothetical protein